MNMQLICRPVLATALLLSSQILAAPTAAEDKLIVGNFSAGVLDNWESKSFKGVTEYHLVQLSGTQVLKAESENAASGLLKTSGSINRKPPI